MPNACYNCGTKPNPKKYDDGTSIQHYVSCSNPMCGIRGGTPNKRTADEAVKEWNRYYGNHHIHNNPKYMHNNPSK
jgi:hypothetical protein